MSRFNNITISLSVEKTSWGNFREPKKQIPGPIWSLSTRNVVTLIPNRPLSKGRLIPVQWGRMYIIIVCRSSICIRNKCYQHYFAVYCILSVTLLSITAISNKNYYILTFFLIHWKPIARILTSSALNRKCPVSDLTVPRCTISNAVSKDKCLNPTSSTTWFEPNSCRTLADINLWPTCVGVFTRRK